MRIKEAEESGDVRLSANADDMRIVLGFIEKLRSDNERLRTKIVLLENQYGDERVNGELALVHIERQEKALAEAKDEWRINRQLANALSTKLADTIAVRDQLRKERDKARKHLRDANRGAETSAGANRLFAEEVNQLRTQLATLTADRWIPVSERLPEYQHRTDVLVRNTYGWIGVGAFYQGEWRTSETNTLIEVATHWQPLPAPPKVTVAPDSEKDAV